MDDRSRARIDEILEAYDRRKQDETRRMVARARELEQARREGADLLRRHVVNPVRDAVSRIEQAGHEVVLDEMLDAYPPGVRLHLWVKPGPMDPPGERPRYTLEFVWGDPNPDHMCVKRWTDAGLDGLVHQEQARSAAMSELWTREQLHGFLAAALER